VIIKVPLAPGSRPSDAAAGPRAGVVAHEDARAGWRLILRATHLRPAVGVGAGHAVIAVHDACGAHRDVRAVGRRIAGATVARAGDRRTEELTAHAATLLHHHVPAAAGVARLCPRTGRARRADQGRRVRPPVGRHTSVAAPGATAVARGSSRAAGANDTAIARVSARAGAIDTTVTRGPARGCRTTGARRAVGAPAAPSRATRLATAAAARQDQDRRKRRTCETRTQRSSGHHHPHEAHTISGPSGYQQNQLWLGRPVIIRGPGARPPVGTGYLRPRHNERRYKHR
jgi:hypothetical protein